MANTIQIKRSEVTSVPSTLAVGELAYSSVSDTLFIGESGSTITAIGGGADVLKLAGIEALATADQTGAEIVSLAVSESDFNALTDALLTKLTNIETGADVTDNANVIAAGAVMTADTDASGYSFVIDEDSMATDSATKLPTQQSVKAYVDTEISAAVAAGVRYAGGYNASTNSPDLDTAPSGITIGDMYTVTSAGDFFGTAVETGDMLIAEIDNPTVVADWSIVQSNLDAASIKANYESNSDTNAFTDSDESKLDGIEALATADQSDAEIKTAYENNADTNAFTDTLLGKLNVIEVGATADQDASEIRALVDSATDSNVFTDADHTKIDGIEDNANAYVLPASVVHDTETIDGGTF